MRCPPLIYHLCFISGTVLGKHISFLLIQDGLKESHGVDSRDFLPFVYSRHIVARRTRQWSANPLCFIDKKTDQFLEQEKQFVTFDVGGFAVEGCLYFMSIFVQFLLLPFTWKVFYRFCCWVIEKKNSDHKSYFTRGLIN